MKILIELFKRKIARFFALVNHDNFYYKFGTNQKLETYATEMHRPAHLLNAAHMNNGWSFFASLLEFAVQCKKAAYLKKDSVSFDKKSEHERLF